MSPQAAQRAEKFDLPGAVFEPEHGTRSRYVRGCRCDECRAANTAAYHARRKLSLEAVKDLERPADGICPGVEGEPCPRGTKLRSDSAAVCRICRRRLSFNGLVDAAPARRHLRRLSRAGIGYKSVSDACDVGKSTLAKIMSGEKRRIRKRRRDAILAVTRDAICDGHLVPAAPVWKMIRELEGEYLGQARLARALGYRSGKIQLGRRRIRARNAQRVRRLYIETFGYSAVDDA